MKNKIFSASIVALASLVVVSCDDYNDQFNIDKTITDVRNTTITLTSGDYAAIAGNATNKAIAAGLDSENGNGTAYADALAAVGTNGYFTALASPEDYIPAFLASSDNYRYADIGSRFTVNVNFYRDPSGYLADLANISSYDFTYYDYEAAWGSNKASYLTPSTLSKIPEILATANPDAQAGDKVVVNYAYSGIEPGEDGAVETAAFRSITARADDAANYTAISDVIADTDGGDYTIKGTVIATYSRGFLVNDGTGSILVYLNAMPNNSVGDVVSVSGQTSAYSGLMQFPATSVVTMIERADDFSYPDPVAMDGEALDAYVAAPEVKYVSYTGTLSISGYYYNVTVDGASASTGSIQYPVSGIVDGSLDGKKVTVTGYLIGVSGGKYTNTMATSVVAADGSAVTDYTPIGEVAYADGSTHNVRGVVAATYARGFLLTDGTGYILVYKSGTGCVTGDIVTVSGDVSEYAGFKQFSSAATVEKVGTGEFALPAAHELDAAAMEAYLTVPYIAFVSYQGKLEIDGNYYNIIIDGAENVEGSLSYPENIDPSLNGRTVIVNGYAIGVSSGRFLNTMVTSVEGVGGITSESNTSVLYAYDGEAWSEYTNDAASIVPLDPTVYAQYGSNKVAGDAIDGVAAAYLVQKVPYAQDGALAAVVYNNGDALVAKEYTFTSGAWLPTPEYDEQSFIFENKAGDGWTADMSTYLNETFIGSTGGFTIQDVSLDGLSYVWQIDGTYGWKASAYVASTNHKTESWIVSPQINLVRATAPFMQFDAAVNFLSGGLATDYCAVLVSTDYTGDVTTAKWTELNITGWPVDGDGWNFSTVDLADLSQFIGSRVYVGFRYKSTTDAAPTWEIKNLKIAEKSEFTGAVETPAE